MADAPLEVFDLTMPVAPGFAFGVEEIRAAAPAIEAAAIALAEQRVDAILQIGGPFAVLLGAEGARNLQELISARVGVPFQMMGLSMLDALRQTHTSEVMICSAYYPEDWAIAYQVFLADSGKKVCGRRSFSELGVASAQDPSSMAVAFEEIGHEAVLTALRKCASAAPDAAVFLAGLPCPLLAHTADLRRVSSAPFVTYLDSYARLFARVDVPVKPCFASK